MLQVFKNKIFFKNKKFSLPTYPNFFGQVTGNRNIFFFGLRETVDHPECPEQENAGMVVTLYQD